jgi:hypothetical protein
MSRWIGVDFDGTLATKGEIRPVPLMIERVKRWLHQGREVRIFTTRADDEVLSNEVRTFLKENGLPDLKITNIKDFEIDEIWDDRCYRVKANTGEVE